MFLIKDFSSLFCSSCRELKARWLLRDDFRRDANVLQNVGLPCIDTLGIRGGNLHRRDEYVEIDSIWERAALFAILMKRIALGETDLDL